MESTVAFHPVLFDEAVLSLMLVVHGRNVSAAPVVHQEAGECGRED